MNKIKLHYNGKVVFEKVELESSFNRFPKLLQEDEACFLFMYKGVFSFRTPTQLIEIGAGEALVAKCGNYFIEPSQKQDLTQPILAFGAYFYPEIIKDFFQTDIKLVAFKNNYDVNPTKVEPLMKLFIESLNLLFENPELADENLILSKLKELLILLGKTEKSIQDFINALFTPFEYDFKEIIQQNTFSNLSLSELASLCGCSLATFKRRFKKYYNQSPAKYILQKKLEKAYQLLSVESSSISEIAYTCGFENTNHFNKAFKKHYEISPSQARNQKSQNDVHLSF